MPTLVIKPLDTVLELGKRTYVPALATSICPGCDEAVVMDLRESYLSYPNTNVPTALSFVCGKCDTAWTKQVVVKLTVEPVE